MNQLQKNRTDQSKPWVWVLFQERLERLRKIEAQSAPRPFQNAIEEKAAEALHKLNDENKFSVKDKYKGPMLCAYLKTLGKLTPQGWKQAVEMIWPAYEGEIGKKPSLGA